MLPKPVREVRWNLCRQAVGKAVQMVVFETYTYVLLFNVHNRARIRLTD
ncbi:MAG: hypothetical protein ACI9HY_002788 [Planctomycetaceae bacterium]|jgi:hypothetical protein